MNINRWFGNLLANTNVVVGILIIVGSVIQASHTSGGLAILTVVGGIFIAALFCGFVGLIVSINDYLRDMSKKLDEA